MTTYKVGDKIKIIDMKDEPLYSGKSGVIEHIDDAGQLHGTWGGLAVIPEVDFIRKIVEVKEEDIDIYENNQFKIREDYFEK